MNDSVWTGEINADMPAEAVDAVRETLKDRRGVPPDNLEDFVRRLGIAWRIAFSKGYRVDRDLAREHFQDVQHAAHRLMQALNRLDHREKEVLEDLVGDIPSLSAIATTSNALSREFSRGRGEYDRIDGRDKFFVFLAAQAWRSSFGQAPSPVPGGLFAQTLEATGVASSKKMPAGKQALRRLIGPA